MLILHNHAVILFWAGNPMPHFGIFSVSLTKQKRAPQIDKIMWQQCHLGLKMGRNTAIFSRQDEETSRQTRQWGSGSALHQFLTWGKSVKSSSFLLIYQAW